jgi:hypothetical protein
LRWPGRTEAFDLNIRSAPEKCKPGSAAIEDYSKNEDVGKRRGVNVKKLYELKVKLVIDDEHREAILDLARHSYSQSGGASTVEDDGSEHLTPAEEAVQRVDDALLELFQSHPCFDEAAIEVTGMSCTSEMSARPYCENLADNNDNATVGSEDECSITDAEWAGDVEEDLDQYESDAYLCRWPNGDISIVSASSKREAIIQLDEWAGAHPSQVYALGSFKADFGLTDDGTVVLNDFGEDTWGFIWDTCYPQLAEVLFSDGVTDENGAFKLGGRERVAEAVRHERERLWENQPTDTPRTELGKRIAERMGTSAIVADHYVEIVAEEILESDEGEGGKPN